VIRGLPAALLALALGACAKAPAAPPPAAGPSAPSPPVAAHDRRQASAQVVSDTGETHQPTTEAVVAGRLESMRADIPAKASVPRVALSDITYPRTQAELKAMGGFALLLVTAVTHDEGELPVDHAEVRIGDKTANLVQVTSRRTQVPAGALNDLFGRYRQDVVYLIPVFATRVRADIYAFLGGGKLQMKLLQLSPPAPGEDMLAHLDYDFDPYEPELAALRRLLDEELPVVGSSGLQQH
jgi:hypothetical protein